MALYFDCIRMLLLAYVDRAWGGLSLLRNKLLDLIIWRKALGESSVLLVSSSATAEFWECQVGSCKDLPLMPCTSLVATPWEAFYRWVWLSGHSPPLAPTDPLSLLLPPRLAHALLEVGPNSHELFFKSGHIPFPWLFTFLV